jgi:hypothetical protein
MIFITEFFFSLLFKPYFEKLKPLNSPDGNGNPVPFFGADCNVQQDEALF